MKSLCIYFFYTLSMISMMRSGIDPDAQAAAPAVSYEQQMESAGAYGDFGDIQVMVGDDWVSIYGEDEKRSLRKNDSDDMDEEVRWGGKTVDWIRMSN